MGGLGFSAHVAERVLSVATGGRVRLWALRFYAQPVPAQPLLPAGRAPAASKLRVGTARPDEIDEAAFDRPTGAVAERFKAGSICVAARSGDDLAGFMWLHQGPLRERMFGCDFEAVPNHRAWWDYDFEVLPRFRLGRTFARLWDEAHTLLRSRGVEATISWIHLSNRASQRAHERAGARAVGWLVLLDSSLLRLGLQSAAPYIRVATGSRRLHVPVLLPDSFPAAPTTQSVARNQTPER